MASGGKGAAENSSGVSISRAAAMRSSTSGEGNLVFRSIWEIYWVEVSTFSASAACEIPKNSLLFFILLDNNDLISVMHNVTLVYMAVLTSNNLLDYHANI